MLNEGRPPGGTDWSLWLIVLVAIVPRCCHLGASPLGIDEATTAQIVGLHWADFIFEIFVREPSMDLYYLLAHFLQFGRTEEALRALPVFFSVLTVPVVYALGVELFDRPTGLISGLLFALNASMLQYAQLARAYSLAILATALSLLYFVRMLKKPARRNFLCWVLASVAMAYAHILSVLIIGAEAAALFWSRSIPWKRLVIGIAIIGAFTTAQFSLIVLADVGQSDWIGPPGLMDIVNLGSLLMGVPFYMKTGPALVLETCFLVALLTSLPLAFRGRMPTFSVAICWQRSCCPVYLQFRCPSCFARYSKDAICCAV